MSSGMRPVPPQARHSFVVSPTTCPASVTVSTKPRPPHSWHGTLTEIVSSAEDRCPPSISEEASAWTARADRPLRRVPRRTGPAVDPVCLNSCAASPRWSRVGVIPLLWPGLLATGPAKRWYSSASAAGCGSEPASLSERSGARSATATCPRGCRSSRSRARKTALRCWARALGLRRRRGARRALRHRGRHRTPQRSMGRSGLRTTRSCRGSSIAIDLAPSRKLASSASFPGRASRRTSSALVTIRVVSFVM
jgi:hypothetical protein